MKVQRTARFGAFMLLLVFAMGVSASAVADPGVPPLEASTFDPRVMHYDELLGASVRYIAAVEMSQAVEYVASQQALEADMNAVGAYIAAVQAAAARVARPSTPSAPPSGGGGRSAGSVGDCTGFSVPDYIIQRESGGDPNAHNPSGAHGCTQTLIQHYNSGGSCAGLDPYTVDGQRQCTWILSDGGTNLAPWSTR